MVTNEMLKALSAEERKSLVDRRMSLRSMYCNGYGAEHLMNMIRSSNALGKTEPGDVAENGARNIVVDILDELGLFDEDFVVFAIKALRDFPLIHKDEGDKGAF